MVLVYITCKSNKEAEKISRNLLEKKLIACANIFPIKSMYWWENEIVEDNEHVIIAKALDFEEVKKAVKRIHSYSVPCILKIDVEANNEYMKWVRNTLGINKNI